MGLKLDRTYVLRSGLAKGLKKHGGLGLGQWRPSKATPDAEETFLQGLDLTGKTILDVGGFQGIFTIFFASRVGPHGRVVTFEPDPVNYRAALRTVAANGFENVTVQNLGVSERPGELEFAYPTDRGWGSAHPDHLDLYGADSTVERMRLPVTSIDAQLDAEQIPPPDFVKIDVEGLELDVLRGMAETVARCKPAIFLELHGWGREAKEANSRRVVEWLDSHGYEISHVETGRRVRPDEMSDVFEGHLYCLLTTDSRTRDSSSGARV